MKKITESGMIPFEYHLKKAIYSLSFKERLLFHLGILDLNCSFKNEEGYTDEEFKEATKKIKKPWWNFLFFFTLW